MTRKMKGSCRLRVKHLSLQEHRWLILKHWCSSQGMTIKRNGMSRLQTALRSELKSLWNGLFATLVVSSVSGSQRRNSLSTVLHASSGNLTRRFTGKHVITIWIPSPKKLLLVYIKDFWMMLFLRNRVFSRQQLDRLLVLILTSSCSHRKLRMQPQDHSFRC